MKFNPGSERLLQDVLFRNTTSARMLRAPSLKAGDMAQADLHAA